MEACMAYITNIDFEGEEELRLDPTQIVAVSYTHLTLPTILLV